MKAREIKKSLLQDYENMITMHKETVRRSQGEIRQLEVVLLKYFGVNKQCNFNYLYDEKSEPEVDDVPF